jgi:DNA-directed RNA polymerase subunit E'/Rpb7
MAQAKLCFYTELTVKVSMLPYQLDSKFDQHLLHNTKNKLEGKTIDSGLVIRVNNILNYNNGIIDKTNFMGTTTMTVECQALICSPQKDQEIVCQIVNVTIKGYLLVKNGSLLVAIRYAQMDAKKFDYDDTGKTVKILYKKNEKASLIELKNDMHVKVSLLNIKKNLNARTITADGKLLDIATDSEIKTYEEERAMIMGLDTQEALEFV